MTTEFSVFTSLGIFGISKVFRVYRKSFFYYHCGLLFFFCFLLVSRYHCFAEREVLYALQTSCVLLSHSNNMESFELIESQRPCPKRIADVN